MSLEVGQVWKQYGKPDYGDIQRWQIVFVKGINAIAVNCATLKQVVIYGEGQIDSFTFDCELTDEAPRLDGYTLKSIGY
jgi:hypothetical protein